MYVFFFTKDEIFKAVKMESSLFAQRQFTKEGNPLFKELVLDENYTEVMPLFRQYFFDVQAEVINIMPSAFLKDCQCLFIEEDAPDDFEFVLKMNCSDNYNCAYFKVISIKVKEAIIAYIMYRWLETKMPEFARVYQGRYIEALNTAKANIHKRGRVGQIRPFPY